MSIQNIPFSIQKRKKNTLNYPKSAAMQFFQGTQERVRNSRGKRAIRVRATEVLLYLKLHACITKFVHYRFTESVYRERYTKDEISDKEDQEIRVSRQTL